MIKLNAGEEVPENWECINEEQQAYLIEWYNICEKDVTFDDLELLADLYDAGQIEFVYCECGTLCFEANPDNWGDFQGTGVGMTEGFNGEYCHDCFEEIKEQAQKAGLI